MRRSSPSEESRGDSLEWVNQRRRRSSSRRRQWRIREQLELGFEGKEAGLLIWEGSERADGHAERGWPAVVVTCGAPRFIQRTPKQRNADAALDGRHVATTRRTRSRYGRRRDGALPLARMDNKDGRCVASTPASTRGMPKTEEPKGRP